MNAGGEALPLGDFGVELFASGPGQRIEAGAPVVLGCAPFGRNPALVLEAVQRRVERALLDAQQIIRNLLDALGDRLPPALLNRPKQGFGVPLVDWFRGSLREFLRDNVTSAAFLDRGLVSPEFLRALLEEHDTGRRDNSHWLWSLLVLSLWFQEMELPVAETVA